MTNEDKARETLASIDEKCYIHKDEYCEDAYKDGFMDGAKWKDEQFKEYVKSKFLQCKNNTANVPLKAGLFDEIIKEILNVEL